MKIYSKHYKKNYNKEVNPDNYDSVTYTTLYLKRSIQRLEMLADRKLNKANGIMELEWFKACFLKEQYKVLNNYYKNLIK